MLQTWTARRHAALAVPTAALALAVACHDSTGPSAGPPAYMRVVSSAFQATAPITGTNPAGCPCTPLAIDLLFDSVTTAPSLVNVPSGTIAAGSAGPAPASLNAFYASIPAGVHSFVARASGPTNPSFFTTSAGGQYLPKQYLTNTTYYTFVIAGVNPQQPASGPGPFASYSVFAAGGFPLFVDDPYTPPALQVNDQSVLQARFRVIDGAPFVLAGPAGGGLDVFVTPSSVVPTSATLATLIPTAQIYYRYNSPYINLNAGSYTLTMAVSFGGPIVYQAPLTLGAGEVRSLVVQNTLPAGVSAIPAGGVPAASARAYFMLTNVLDNRYP